MLWATRRVVQTSEKSIGGERILVVDDDEDVRELTVYVLQHGGYDVISARNGEEALVAVGLDPSIDLLLTDIVMPGLLNGWQLARRARAIRPALRVIYMTGYARVLPIAEDGPGLGPLLPKPWRPDQLLACVKQVLRRFAVDAPC